METRDRQLGKGEEEREVVGGWGGHERKGGDMEAGMPTMSRPTRRARKKR